MLTLQLTSPNFQLRFHYLYPLNPSSRFYIPLKTFRLKNLKNNNKRIRQEDENAVDMGRETLKFDELVHLIYSDI